MGVEVGGPASASCFQMMWIHTICSEIQVLLGQAVCAGLPALCWDLFCGLRHVGLFERVSAALLDNCFFLAPEGFPGRGVELNIIVLVNVPLLQCQRPVGFKQKRLKAS